MKKCLAIVGIVLVFNLCGCSYLLDIPYLKQAFSETEAEIQDEMESKDLYPFYDSLTQEEKAIYIKICDAMENFETEEFWIAEYGSKEESRGKIDRIGEIYEMVIYEHPEFFWVNQYEYRNVTWEIGNSYHRGLQMEYLMDATEANEKKAALDQKVDAIVQGAEDKNNTFEKVLYVYDEILKCAEYDDALAESDELDDVSRSVYGCLVEGKTVCTGYSLAFNMIMQELGYRTGVEFDKNCERLFADGHVWNYAELDGECYYFDLTWDDLSVQTADGTKVAEYTHQYFGITEQELTDTHERSEKAKTPSCEGTQYDYFIYNKLNADVYDYVTVKQILQSQQGQKYAVVKFDTSEECNKAVYDLIENSRIFDIYPDLDEISYVSSESNRHLYIMFE